MAVTPQSIQALMAILIIGILAIVAMNFDVNGEILALAIVAIAGLGGYELYQRSKVNGTPL